MIGLRCNCPIQKMGCFSCLSHRGNDVSNSMMEGSGQKRCSFDFPGSFSSHCPLFAWWETKKENRKLKIAAIIFLCSFSQKLD